MHLIEIRFIAQLVQHKSATVEMIFKEKSNLISFPSTGGSDWVPFERTALNIFANALQATDWEDG